LDRSGVVFSYGLVFLRESKFKGRGAGEGAWLPPRPSRPPSGGLFGLCWVVDFRRGSASVGGVRPAFVVEAQAVCDLPVSIDHRLVAFQINLLILETAPEPLDEDVV
jgi:hypothetical protein